MVIAQCPARMLLLSDELMSCCASSTHGMKRITLMKCFWATCEALYTTVRVSAQAAGFRRSWRFDFLAQNYELLQSTNCLLGCERVMETRAEFHFSWVYTFSAMLSSLRN